MAENNIDNSGFLSNEDTTPIKSKLLESPHFGNQSLISAESSPQQLEDKKTDYISRENTENEKSLEIKLYGNLYHFDTKGKESIYDMAIRMIEEVEHGHRPNVDRMLFKTALDDCCLNLGLPTGALKKDVTYELSFKGNSKQKTTDSVRKYYVEEFHENWNINSFDIKFEALTVSYMQKIEGVSRVRVDFFPEETLYEALRRDERFEISSQGRPFLTMCDFQTINCPVNGFLSAKAAKYAGQCLILKKRRKANENLPLVVPPLPRPSHILGAGTSTSTSIIVKGDPETASELHVKSETPQISSQPSALEHSASATKNVKKIRTREDLLSYIEENLGLNLREENTPRKENQRKKKIEKFFSEHYQEFALNYPHSFSMSDLEHTTKLKFCIGAVISVNVSGVESFVGTCFRIGKKYVITNYHVVKLMVEKVSVLKKSFVDFNYKKGEGDSVCFADVHDPILVYSAELDYAIIELDDTEIPASLTDLGYSVAPPSRRLVAGEHLSLIGHPNNMEKMVNICCPIKQQQDMEEHLSLALHVLDEKKFISFKEFISNKFDNQNIVKYDVSNFFEGSSGSPGILINEKLLIVLHFEGAHLLGKKVLEMGILMSSIVEDVQRKKSEGSMQHLPSLDEIFGEGTLSNFQSSPMEID